MKQGAKNIEIAVLYYIPWMCQRRSYFNEFDCYACTTGDMKWMAEEQ